MKMSAPLAADDVVATHAAAAANARDPLVVLAPLRAFLAQHGLVGDPSGALVVEPLGEGHSNVTLLLRCGDGEHPRDRRGRARRRRPDRTLPPRR